MKRVHYAAVSQVEPTGAELIKSGIGKVVAGLRKHSSAGISEKATALRNRWADIVVSNCAAHLFMWCSSY